VQDNNFFDFSWIDLDQKGYKSFFSEIESTFDIFDDCCSWIQSIEDPNLTLFSSVIWEQSGVADFLFVDNITGEVSKDSKQIDFRVQSSPSWSSDGLNFSIVAPCNESLGVASHFSKHYIGSG
jgi:hypothetical protein